MNEQRIGIIDIGSNSIRLVIYERTPRGAYRVIDGCKQSGRLSDHVGEDGRLGEAAVDRLSAVLRHFKLVCEHHRTDRIRAAATAAIRNSANGEEIIRRLHGETGIAIEVLSGEQEAAFGFLGMIQTMDIQDGFLIDIGGGSTELTLFQGGEIIRSVSFPIGCVNTAKRFTEGGAFDDKALERFEQSVAALIRAEPWAGGMPGLPLVGVGGTVRALAKVHQARIKYPLPIVHGYTMTAPDTDALFDALNSMPLDKRKKTPGLSKDRADLIVPGLAILRAFASACGAGRIMCCGAGLRDGLFFDSCLPADARTGDVLARSITSMRALYPDAPDGHIRQVNRLALELFEALEDRHPFDSDARTWLHTASMLYRIGSSIDYYHYAKHTFYLMLNANLNGLSHRGLVIAAAIAAFKSKSWARQLQSEYKLLITEGDIETICRLGTLLELAVALDRSESQPLLGIEIEVQDGKLTLTPADRRGPLEMERKEVESLAADFKKIWELTPALTD